jgi:hypothetical protein
MTEFRGDIVSVPLRERHEGRYIHRSVEEIREDLIEQIGGAAVVGVIQLNGHPLRRGESATSDSLLVVVNRPATDSLLDLSVPALHGGGPASL